MLYLAIDKAWAEYIFMADFSGEAFFVYKNDKAIKKLKTIVFLIRWRINAGGNCGNTIVNIPLL